MQLNNVLHLFLFHIVDHISFQESNLNSSSSFLALGYSALQSDCTHSRPGILFPDDPHASGGVIIFVRQGLSYSELSTSLLFSLDLYFDYVKANISLNNSSSFSLLNVYASPICSSLTDSRTDSLFPSRNLFILRDFYCHHFLWGSKSIPDSRREELFDWVISSDLLPVNDSNTPTLLLHSS